MKKLLLILVVFLSVSFVFADDFNKKKSEQISKELILKASPDNSVLYIRNVWGYLEVEGYSGNTIRLEIEKTLHAKDEENLKKAIEEVNLEIVELENGYFIYIQTPNTEFDLENMSVCHNGCGEQKYKYVYNFKVKVPESIQIHASTVMDGDVSVENIKGLLYARDVNGSVYLENVSHVREAKTVNGDVTIDFTDNPDVDCEISTINGDITLNLHSRLSADVSVKTMNGEFYTDFDDITLLPNEINKSEKGNDKSWYKLSGTPLIRFGKGGPRLSLSNINGDFTLKH